MKVSVLIPMFNAEKYISDTIENVLKQTYNNIEVIIVDDGSSDNSYKIALGYESDKVHVYRQDNKGASAARNFAFEQSTGELIQYLDADDILSYNKIESQVKFITSLNDRYAVVTSGLMRFDEDLMSTVSAPYNQVSTKFFNKPIDLLVDIYYEKNIVQSSIWLVHRALIEKTGRWNESLTLNDDYEFFFRVVSLSSGVYFCPHGVVFYRNTPLSLSKQISLSAIKSQLLATKIMTYVMLSLKDDKYVRGACVNYYMLYLTRFRNDFYRQQAGDEVKKLGYNINSFKKSRIHRMAYMLLGDKLMKKISGLYYKK